MSTRKTTAERIEAQRERMEQMQNEMKELMRKHNAEERKKRNHRISTRGAHIEKLLPDTIGLSDGRFFTFLEKTVANDFGKKILVTLKAEQDKEDAKNAQIQSEGDGDTPDEPSIVAMAQGGSEPALKSAAPKLGSGDTDTLKPAQIATSPIGVDGNRTGDGGATQGA